MGIGYAWAWFVVRILDGLDSIGSDRWIARFISFQCMALEQDDPWMDRNGRMDRLDGECLCVTEIYQDLRGSNRGNLSMIAMGGTRSRSDRDFDRDIVVEKEESRDRRISSLQWWSIAQSFVRVHTFTLLQDRVLCQCSSKFYEVHWAIYNPMNFFINVHIVAPMIPGFSSIFSRLFLWAPDDYSGFYLFHLRDFEGSAKGESVSLRNWPIHVTEICNLIDLGLLLS